MSHRIGSSGRSPLQRVKCRKDSFGIRKQRVFLEHLAATCNVGASARAAGTTYATCYRARNRMPAFAAAWEQAIQHGYRRLEEALMAQALGAIDPVAFDPDAVAVVLGTGDDDADGVGAGEGRGAGNGDARGPAPAGLAGKVARTDVQLALSLLNHRSATRSRRGARNARRATAEEVEAAINAKLDSLARRIGARRWDPE